MAEYYQSLKHAKKRLGRGRISARTIFPGSEKKLELGLWMNIRKAYLGELPQGAPPAPPP